MRRSAKGLLLPLCAVRATLLPAACDAASHPSSCPAAQQRGPAAAAVAASMGVLGDVGQLAAGVVVMLVKLPFVVLPAIWKGKAPGRFDPAPSLGAALLGKQSGFVDVFLTSADGTRLHAVEDDQSRRKPGRRPIVFVHGFPELWLSWRAQLEHYVGRGHPVLALSMRGYGLSDKPPGVADYNTVKCLVPDVAAAVAHAAAAGGAGCKPLLVAHDWGAGVCWPFVSWAGGDDLVAGYVSLSNAPSEAFAKSMATPSQMWASSYMLFFNAPYLPEALLLANRAWMTALILNDVQQEPISKQAMDAYRTNVLQPGALTAQLNYYRAALAEGGSNELSRKMRLGPRRSGAGRRLELPVLMVRGKQDIALLAGMFEGYGRYLANGRLVELDACSHWVQHDASPRLNVEIDAFLEELNDAS
jgi:pimeloyl-ACP methyl ester carboxylesterase